jgi:hypothetical protein
MIDFVQKHHHRTKVNEISSQTKPVEYHDVLMTLRI